MMRKRQIVVRTREPENSPSFSTHYDSRKHSEKWSLAHVSVVLMRFHDLHVQSFTASCEQYCIVLILYSQLGMGYRLAFQFPRPILYESPFVLIFDSVLYLDMRFHCAACSVQQSTSSCAPTCTLYGPALALDSPGDQRQRQVDDFLCRLAWNKSP